MQYFVEIPGKPPLLNANGGTVDMGVGEAEWGEGTGRSGERGGCAGDALYERRINK